MRAVLVLVLAACAGGTRRSEPAPTRPDAGVVADEPAPAGPPRLPADRHEAWLLTFRAALHDARADLAACRERPPAGLDAATCACRRVCAMRIAPPPDGVAATIAFSYGGSVSVRADGTIESCRLPADAGEVTLRCP